MTFGIGFKTGTEPAIGFHDHLVEVVSIWLRQTSRVSQNQDMDNGLRREPTNTNSEYTIRNMERIRFMTFLSSSGNGT